MQHLLHLLRNLLRWLKQVFGLPYLSDSPFSRQERMRDFEETSPFEEIADAMAPAEEMEKGDLGEEDIFPDIPPKQKRSKAIDTAEEIFPESPAGSAQAPEEKTADTAVSTASGIQGDIVNITAYSPEQVKRNDSFLISVFAHLYEQRAEVQALAQELDPENRRQGGKTLNTPIERGGKLEFRLSIEDWEMPDPVQQLIWFGQPASVEFEVEVPKEYEKEKAIGTLIVSNANGPVGRMRFNVSVEGNPVEHPRTDPSGFAETESASYTQAYLSYAAEDQELVDTYLQQFQQNKIDNFFNITEKEEDWEDQVLLHLRKSDLFLLFWSDHADNSEEVSVEWQTALGLRYGGEERLPDFVPVLLGESWPDPPYDLAFLNFRSHATTTETREKVQGETLEALKARCEQLISEGEIEVFDLMREYFEADEELVNDLYSLENQWNTAKRKARLKLWSEEQIRLTKSQITFSVLGLIGEMN